MIKTYKEACNKLGRNPNDLPDVSSLPEKHRNAVIAYHALVIITEALNDGWEPNWDNMNESKWCPYFRIKQRASGVGFSFSDYGLWTTGTDVGSRLCFKSQALAEYAAKQFEFIYEEYILIKKAL